MQLEENADLVKLSWFISMKNIIILFVSSDDFTRLIWIWKIANIDYSVYICMNEKKKARRKKKTM